MAWTFGCISPLSTPLLTLDEVVKTVLNAGLAPKGEEESEEARHRKRTADEADSVVFLLCLGCAQEVDDHLSLTALRIQGPNPCQYLAANRRGLQGRRITLDTPAEAKGRGSQATSPFIEEGTNI